MSTRDFLSKPYTVRLEKLLSNGCALAHADGMAVFVPYGVPGEEVQIEITESKKGYLVGRITGISDSSPDRVIPKCKLFGRCGGCTLQHIDYSRQLVLKKEMLTEALVRTGHLKKEHIPEIKTFASSPFGYRQRIQLHPTGNGSAGYMSASSHDVLPVGECPVCCTGINNMLKEKKLDLTERTVFYSPNGSTVQSAYFTGKKEFTFKMRDKTITANPLCFFQSNGELYQKVVEELIANIPAGDTYVDFYSGIALPGLFMADRFNTLYFVEENPVSAGFGIKNIQELGNCRFFNMKAEEWIKSPRGKVKADTVFLDPPRTGLADSISDYLLKKKPQHIFYLSCNFTTLARDLGKLAQSYRIKMLDIFDFYPQTADLEVLAMLE